MDMNSEVFMKTYNDGNDVILEFTAAENSGRYKWEETAAINSELDAIGATIRASEWNIDRMFFDDENYAHVLNEEQMEEVQSPVYLLNQEQMDAIESALSGMAAMIRAHEWNVDDSLPIDKVASEVAIDLYKPRLFEARTIVLDLLRNPI